MSHQQLSGNLGTRLRISLEIRHMSQRRLAIAIGAKEDSVSGWIHNRYQPNATSLVKICRTLYVSADWLLGLWEGE